MTATFQSTVVAPAAVIIAERAIAQENHTLKCFRRSFNHFHLYPLSTQRLHGLSKILARISLIHPHHF